MRTFFFDLKSKTSVFILIIFFNLFSISSGAAENVYPWSEIYSESIYKLNVPLIFNEQDSILKDTLFELINSGSDSSAPVFILQMQAQQCAIPQLSSEMILVNPVENSTNLDFSVGVQLHPDCIIDIYVEGKNYFDPSLFYQ